jgi:hypothetical protein
VKDQNLYGCIVRPDTSTEKPTLNCYETVNTKAIQKVRKLEALEALAKQLDKESKDVDSWYFSDLISEDEYDRRIINLQLRLAPINREIEENHDALDMGITFDLTQCSIEIPRR